VSEVRVPLPAPPGPDEAKVLPVPRSFEPEQLLSTKQWGMAAFLLSEVAFFSTLIVTYLTFLGQDPVPPGVTDYPTPRTALSLGLVICTTICLLSSSGTIHVAETALGRGQQMLFCLWLAVTIGLGVAFLGGTAYEWRELIERHHLTIGRNLFGTTYYTLVGFHALHVTIGVVVMLIVLSLALRRQVTVQNHDGVQLVGWYWHFVDAVWVVVFTVVYVVGR
jgi:cytochrome c oxidase subunit 3/cytochrome o ubiquinol oxidase subunit 3